MFDDWDWIPDATAVQMARCQFRTSGARVAIIEIGAGTRLDTIRRESEILAAGLNADLIRIHVREAEGSEGTISIKLSGLEALERIDAWLPADFKGIGRRHEQSSRAPVDCPSCSAP